MQVHDILLKFYKFLLYAVLVHPDDIADDHTVDHAAAHPATDAIDPDLDLGHQEAGGGSTQNLTIETSIELCYIVGSSVASHTQKMYIASFRLYYYSVFSIRFAMKSNFSLCYLSVPFSISLAICSIYHGAHSVHKIQKSHKSHIFPIFVPIFPINPIF